MLKRGSLFLSLPLSFHGLKDSSYLWLQQKSSHKMKLMPWKARMKDEKKKLSLIKQMLKSRLLLDFTVTWISKILYFFKASFLYPNDTLSKFPFSQSLCGLHFAVKVYGAVTDDKYYLQKIITDICMSFDRSQRKLIWSSHCSDVMRQPETVLSSLFYTGQGLSYDSLWDKPGPLPIFINNVLL